MASTGKVKLNSPADFTNAASSATGNHIGHCPLFVMLKTIWKFGFIWIPKCRPTRALDKISSSYMLLA